MSDQMPMFEDPAPPVEPKPPKKPRQKPVRKPRKVASPKPVPKKRRKKYVLRVNLKGAGFKELPKDKHAGGRYSKDVYATIGKLMGMNNAERSAVLDIVKGLTDGRAD